MGGVVSVVGGVVCINRNTSQGTLSNLEVMFDFASDNNNNNNKQTIPTMTTITMTTINKQYQQ